MAFRGHFLFNELFINPFPKFDHLSYTKITELIEADPVKFTALCESHNVKILYAFGSATSDSFDEKTSDVDLRIEIEEQDPLNRGQALLDLWDEIEKFFRRKLDLLTTSSIRKPYLRDSIETSKVLVYNGWEQEISV